MDRFIVRGKRKKDETDDSLSQERQSSTPQSVCAPHLTSKNDSQNPKRLKTNEKVILTATEKEPTVSAIPQAYQRWKLSNPWIDLNDSRLMICSICTAALNVKLVLNLSSHELQSKETWVDKRFGSWKHGAERLTTHSKSSLHRTSAEALHSRDKVNVVQHLSTAQQKEMMDHRTALRKIFSSLRILGRQGLAIRGAGNDENSNFMAILRARAEDVVELETWLRRTGQKWLHHDVQNEILQAMATEVMTEIIRDVQASDYFSILLDETADISRTEQVSIYLRVVSAELISSEYFLGFYSTTNTKAETLFEIVKDVLVRFNLPLSKLRGQCYDGAANVSGKISGLQQRIREEEPRALFVHCNAHNLNLVVQDGIEKVLPARKFIGEVKDLINFVRDSPKRLAKFQDLQAAENADSDKDVPALAAYCPTRWVVRIKSLKTVLANYKVLMAFFQDVFEDPDVDSTDAAKAAGFLHRMETFEFLFLLTSMIQIFDRIEILNADLQRSELCVTDSYQKIEAVSFVLESSRDSKFDGIWLNSMKTSEEFDIEEPKFPRKRKSKCSENVFNSPEQYFRKIYCEIYDQVTCSLKSRFDTESAKFFKSLECFVIGGIANLDNIIAFYKEDFDATRLESDKDIFLAIMRRKGKDPTSLQDVVQFMRENSWCKGLVPEYLRFVRLLMTIPGSSCSNERSFSVLRRIKNYLRSTMHQSRLNHTAVLHTYPEILDQVNLDKLMDAFIVKNTKRASVFALQN